MVSKTDDLNFLTQLQYIGPPRGPYDRFDDGTLCFCSGCTNYRDSYTKEEWLRSIDAEY